VVANGDIQIMMRRKPTTTPNRFSKKNKVSFYTLCVDTYVDNDPKEIKIDQDMVAIKRFVELCLNKDILPEVIYLAFAVKDKYPQKDAVNCMSIVLWDWLIKSERINTGNLTPEKIQKSLEKFSKKD